MNEESPADRGRAMEEELLRRQGALLAARRRTDAERQAARAALAAASRITDAGLLDRLVASGITADTLTVLSLVPLVEIAWADGKIEASERRAILAAAEAVGLNATRAGFGLLQRCLAQRPAPQLRAMWEHYIGAVCATLSPQQLDELKGGLLHRARCVAGAAGGLLGLGSRVSAREKALLGEIELVLDRSRGHA